jgi:hypothetical protein
LPGYPLPRSRAARDHARPPDANAGAGGSTIRTATRDRIASDPCAPVRLVRRHCRLSSIVGFACAVGGARVAARAGSPSRGRRVPRRAACRARRPGKSGRRRPLRSARLRSRLRAGIRAAAPAGSGPGCPLPRRSWTWHLLLALRDPYLNRLVSSFEWRLECDSSRFPRCVV